MGNNSYLVQNINEYSSPSKILLEHTHFGYMWTTVKTNKIVASHTVYTLLETEPFSELLTEEKWRSYVHPLDLFKLVQAEELLMETGRPCICEYRIITKSGKHIFLNHQMQLSINHDNHVKILSILDDITEQKHAEVILEVMNEGFFELDRQYKFRRINAKTELLWNIKREDVIGKSIWDVFPAAKSTSFYELVIKTVHEKNNIVQDVVGPVNDHWLHFSGSPFNDGTIVIFYDIQNEKEAEEKIHNINATLAKKNKELEQRNKELVSLSNVASHDLKEPLRRIYTAVEAIITGEAQKLSNNGKAHLRRIQSSAQRMGLITDDLLSFTGITKEKNTEDYSEVDLNKVLEDAKAKMQRLLDENSAIIKAEKFPHIYGNYNLLVQLFQNIIHNAVKFQRNNLPEINISVKQVKKENENYLSISFKDNGIGFKQQDAENIFNLFTKLHPVEEFRGSGMGLAICKKIMEQHDGLIEAVAEEDKGAEICCYFPDTLK